ncbi:MAG: UDP-2,4-diacetamido-2,4,6-trideoxy-beta-L-altropyranose hydrolase [Burkholderiales bacterium]|nr:UDP-2,4-diacetamido-2,4,6-trideoxy-beta-L-altropyranose hydrolase [Burkholderiales bacterium]
MTVAFRADASSQIGTGHVMRCLALASALKEKAVFLCREYPGHLFEQIESSGHLLIRLPTPEPPDRAHHDARDTLAALEKTGGCDWLVADHYAIDACWEESMRSVSKKIMVIDDLSDRNHDCDLLLDQNLHAQNRYNELTPSTCIKLLGPQYALLRPEFRQARANLRAREGKFERILVFFGGSDPGNATTRALEAIQGLEATDLAIDVVAGNANPHLEDIRQSCESMPGAIFHRQAKNMQELMMEADLAIGAGGIATWERCCLGLPSIVISIAPNQESIAQCAAEFGALRYLGKADEVPLADIIQALKQMMGDRNRLLGMSEKGKSLVDGLGAVRVAHIMNSISQNGILLRHAFENDARKLFEWRNAPETRRHAFNPDRIAWEDHLAWLKNSLSNPDRHLLIGEQDHRPIGVLRYDLAGSIAEVSVYLVPGLYGRGLGSRLIEAGTIWAGLNLPNIATLRARILTENIASRKAFAKAGYMESNGIYEYHLPSNKQDRT